MLSHEVAISQQSAECRNCAISSAATIRPLAVVRSERYLVPMTDSINNIDASSLPEPDRVEIERLRAAYDLSRPAREHRGNSPVVNIHVSAYRSNRGDATQRVYNFGTSNVAAMNDVIDASQATLRLRSEQPVRVGDDPDPEGHRWRRPLVRLGYCSISAIVTTTARSRTFPSRSPLLDGRSVSGWEKDLTQPKAAGSSRSKISRCRGR